MEFWRLTVKEYEHGQNETITKYYLLRNNAVAAGLEIVKTVLLEESLWNELEEYVLPEQMILLEEAYNLLMTSHHEVGYDEMNMYKFWRSESITLTLKIIRTEDRIY